MMTHMHTLYRRHGTALGVSGYNAFCMLWPKVCALLDAPAKLETIGQDGSILGSWGVSKRYSVAECVELHEGLGRPVGTRRRIVLLDGTVIREWPGAR